MLSTFFLLTGFWHDMEPDERLCSIDKAISAGAIAARGDHDAGAHTYGAPNLERYFSATLFEGEDPDAGDDPPLDVRDHDPRYQVFTASYCATIARLEQLPLM